MASQRRTFMHEEDLFFSGFSQYTIYGGSQPRAVVTPPVSTSTTSNTPTTQSGMTKGVNSAAEQAEQLKQDGNLYFKKNRLGAAIDAYTEAITLCPKVPVYWTNRALCHRKRNDWGRVEEDCLKAVQLDHKTVKGHYMLGLALLQREKYGEGIKALERALDLGRGEHPNSYMVEEIWQELARSKYQEWERDSTKRTLDLEKLEDFCEIALKETHLNNVSQKDDGTDEVAEQLAALKLVFRKAAESDTPADVPDYICCKITLDIFRDPVITPCGLTYERAAILDHLEKFNTLTYERAAILDHIEKVGKFDPTTRENLFPSQLIPNLAIKEAVVAYLEKHGWAYKMD